MQPGLLFSPHQHIHVGLWSFNLSDAGQHSMSPEHKHTQTRCIIAYAIRSAFMLLRSVKTKLVEISN